jgi:hypothetical protein
MPKPPAAPVVKQAAAPSAPPKLVPVKPVQRAAAPAAKPPGQTVDDMLSFIADKIGDQNRLNFTAEFLTADGSMLVEQLAYEASKVTIDPNRCQLSYHWHVVQDGKGTPDQDRAVQLRLSKSISVETIDRALGDINDNHFTVHVHPQGYAVHIARWDNPSGDNLYFRDKDMAESVARAARQALELCDKAAARFGH